MKSYKAIVIFLFFTLVITGTVDAGCDDGQIDINSASLTELDKIVWVGPITAEKIINKRPYGNIEELDEVSGIGEGKLGDIIDEGIACINDGENEIIFEKENEITKDIILKEKRENEIVILGEDKTEEELVYISKNGKVENYLIYGFAIFLIFIIGFLIFRN